jgi:XTP/dITP diphosphohydrolase
MKLLLATANLHKLLELKGMLKSAFPKIDLYSLRDFKDYQPCKETEDSFEENAKLKALSAAKHFNMLSLADDSGLVIPSLGGKPGVNSAHFAGENATDKENMLKLLEEMRDLEGDKRNGHYTCTLALANPSRVIKVVSADCEGRITESLKGAAGFGYDPIFIKHDYNATFGELSAEIKCRISHRRKAMDKIIPMLESYLHCTI